ncbi:ISAs1 family transposase [Legionella brunensis]|uniref:ISAs1 family transposase n=1 Tax=Legionella brunensis TaxID=29422 RepID=UPI000730DDE4|nr:ISAs1 family transposase [Legionella brunensis]
MNTKQFANCFSSWIQVVTKATDGAVIAIDGKTLRRSFNTSDEKSAIHMVSAWNSANGIVLGQEKTAEKSNEITAIPELLNSLAIEGCIVTHRRYGLPERYRRANCKAKRRLFACTQGESRQFS